MYSELASREALTIAWAVYMISHLELQGGTSIQYLSALSWKLVIFCQELGLILSGYKEG